MMNIMGKAMLDSQGVSARTKGTIRPVLACRFPQAEYLEEQLYYDI